MSSPERPPKPEAFLALLKEGWTSLHLDARRAGVLVPPGLKAEAHLVLQYGHDLPIPIPDLEVGEDGVRATLSFSRTPHRTLVPWSAVYAITCNDPRSCGDGRGVLYPEDVPEDVAVIAAQEPLETAEASDARPAEIMAAGAEGAAETALEPGAPVRRLRSIPAAPEAEPLEPSARPLPATRRRRRPQLRLVK